MPGNEVGDRVHNFFAQDNLSQGQHSQVLGGNWPSDNSLWVGSQKEVGGPSSSPKVCNPQQSEIELGHSNRVPVPHGFNFMQTNARLEFAKNQSQSQQQNLKGYMYGRHVFLPRPDEANFLGLDTDSGQNNVNQRGFLVHELQQEGASEQTSKNSNRSDAFDAHGSLDLFGGQHQMNGQHPGLLQPLQQQQSGFSDIQHLQQQLMLRKMQELQRQKDMRQLDTRQHNSVNQSSPFARQASGSHSHGLVNGTPTSESSWAELATGNTNWLRHASPAMQGSSSGLVLSPHQGEAQRSVGFVHQQVDQSLYGVPVSSSRGLLNPYPYVATDKASNQQMPTYGNSFPGNQYAGIPEQVIIQDGTSVSRQSLPGKSLFGHTSGQCSDSGINMEQIQQLKSMQQIGSQKEFQGTQDLIGPSEIVQDKPATEAISSHGAASLDPDEEKILFGSDENIWEAFGSSRNMDGGASNLLDDGEFASGLPSIQSGSWSALMQSAAAETSSSGIDLQEEWAGLDFQNPDHSLGRRPPTYEDSGKQQTALADVNLPNASAMRFGIDGAETKDKYHSNMGFQHHDKESPYEHDERPDINSSGQMNQRSSGGSKWLNRGPLQKVDAEGSRLYGNASNSESGEMNAKSISGHWTSQQYGNSLPYHKRNDRNPIDSVRPPGDASPSINENGNSLQQFQSNNRKRVMHEETGLGNGIWRVNALSNSNVNPEPRNTSMGSPQINREGFAVNSTASIPNLSNIQGGNHFGQFPSNSHHLNYWKHVESSVKSKGSENSRRSQRHLNKGPQVSESSFNSSDKEDLKMHEMESSSKRENSNDSYQSSSSHQATTRLRENLSNQAGRKTSGSRKFQYHPMGNLDEDVEIPYGTRQGTNTQAMSLQHFPGLRGHNQANLGQTKTGGQVPISSPEVGKGHVPDLEGIAKGSHDMRSKGMIGGHLPNMFAPSDRSVGLSTSEKASQPSQNMLELLHKVDQSRDRGTVRHFNSSERILSSEMPEPEHSDGSLGGLQRSQSSNSQGFGLQLGPPSQRLPLPNNTSNSLSQAQVSANQGQAVLPSLPPFQETSRREFKNNRIGSSEQDASENSVHKMKANLSSSLGAVFSNSRSQLQNHQMIGARGLTLTNDSDNESFSRHAPQMRQTDETCNGPFSIQSAEGSLPNKASCGRYDDAASNHERVQALQTSGGEKLLASLSQTSSGISQHGGFSKMLPNEWTSHPTQQQLFATHSRRERLNHCQSSQLNIVESTSSGLQNLEDQEAEKGGNIFPKFGTSSLNLQGLASVGEQSAKDSLSQNVLSGKVDRSQMMNGPLGKESVIKPLSDALSVNPTASQRDLEAFGRSLKPNNFHQNYSLMNQMRAMKNMDNDPCNRVTKRLKGSVNFLDGQQVASWSGQPNEHNNMVGDVSTCSTTAPPGDSQMLNFSGPADNVEQTVPLQPGYVRSKDMLASVQNESQSYVPGNSMPSIKADHSHISPRMAPSWFDQYGTSKNGQLLPPRVDAVRSIEQPFSVGRLSGGLETHNSKEQASSAADTSQVGVMKNPAPPSLALEQSSPPLPTIVGVQNLVTLSPKKRRLATSDLHPWLVEVSGSFKNLEGICTGAVEWSGAANRIMEKVDDDGEVIEEALPMPRPKRRLILTTLLMQQLLRPPPAAILSTDASSNYESVVYYAARLALGDACNLVSSARSYSSISHTGANSLSDKSRQSERIDDHPLSKVMEDFMCKAGKLEDDFLRLDKRTSILDLRVECQDVEKFSVINRFARFHGRFQADGAENSSSEAAAHALKPFPQRYVTAVPLPANLPDRVQCLSL